MTHVHRQTEETGFLHLKTDADTDIDISKIKRAPDSAWDVKLIVPEPEVLFEEQGDMIDNRINRSQYRCRLWMFSPITGNLLEFDDGVDALVDGTGFERDYKLINGYRVKLKTRMDRYRREYELDPLVKDYYQYDTSGKFQRATVMEVCEKCGHDEMEFFTMQLRSADEGQTVFFECPKCGHKWRTNN